MTVHRRSTIVAKAARAAGDVHTFHRAAVWTAVALTVLGCALAGSWGGERATLWYDDIVTAATAALAAVVVLRHGARRDPLRRAMWRFLGAALVAWTIGEAAWAVYELGPTGHVPFPSFADVGYLLAIPFATAALMASPALRLRRSLRARALLDSLIVAGGTLYVAWAELSDRSTTTAKATRSTSPSR